MAHHLLSSLTRNERRLIFRGEEARRAAGDWGVWEHLSFPAGTAGSGWAADFTIAHKNLVFSVLDRTTSNGVQHLAISSLSGIRPSWWEAQRIKDELAGEGATAVEIYPPRNEVVDEADMYHLWVLPKGLDFGLKRGAP